MVADRDRDRKAKDKKVKKKGSVTSDSAERSRDREMRRRKQQQQFVAKSRKPDAAPAPGVPPSGQGMFWDGFQWVPRADAGTALNDTRKSRRLWIGNLPYNLGVTEDMFTKQLYEAMRDRGFCNDANQNPVLHVWFAREKGANYGFCEVATIEETERALHLDGMLVLGVPISIKRPNDSGVAEKPQGQIANVSLPPGASVLPAGGHATSPIIRIDELLKVDARTTNDDYIDVVEDMREGCEPHGKVLGVLIIRPEHLRTRPGMKPGDVYLQCATTDDATKIIRAMGHRKYDGRQILMTCFDEAKFSVELRPLM